MTVAALTELLPYLKPKPSTLSPALFMVVAVLLITFVNSGRASRVIATLS